MSRLKTASEMRQKIKAQEYDSDSVVARTLMNRIEQATSRYETSVSNWYPRGEARQIDLTFSPLGYMVTYKEYDKVKDSYWISVEW